MGPTPSALEALRILRSGATFQWYVIPLLAIAVYVYAVEIERRNWRGVFAGLAFCCMDWVNEILNGLVFHFTQYAPIWGAPGHTAFLVLIGLNVEILFMFAIAGVVWVKILPADRATRLLGVPSRWFLAIAGSVFCVVVEMLLNAAGALTWDYAWWGRSSPIPIVVFGYLPFFLVAFWVHDMDDVRRQARVVAVLSGAVVIALAVFVGALRWI